MKHYLHFLLLFTCSYSCCLAQKEYEGIVKSWEYQLNSSANHKDSFELYRYSVARKSNDETWFSKEINYENNKPDELTIHYSTLNEHSLGNYGLRKYMDLEGSAYSFSGYFTDSVYSDDCNIKVEFKNESEVILNEIRLESMREDDRSYKTVLLKLKKSKLDEIIACAKREISSKDLAKDLPVFTFDDFILLKKSAHKYLTEKKDSWTTSLNYRIDSTYLNGLFYRRDSVNTRIAKVKIDSVAKIYHTIIEYPDDLSKRQEELFIDSLSKIKEEFRCQLWIRDTLYSIRMKSEFDRDTNLHEYSIRGSVDPFNTSAFYKRAYAQNTLHSSIRLKDSLYELREFQLMKDRYNCILSAEGYAKTRYGEIVQMKVVNFNQKVYQSNIFRELLIPAHFIDSADNRVYYYPSILGYYPNLKTLSYGWYPFSESHYTESDYHNLNGFQTGTNNVYPYIDTISHVSASPEDLQKAIENKEEYEKKTAKLLKKYRRKAKRNRPDEFRQSFEIPKQAREKTVRNKDSKRTFIEKSKRSYYVYEVELL